MSKYVITQRSYVIHDRPIDDHVANELTTGNADALSISELINSAMGEELTISRIVHEYGSHVLASLKNAQQIEEILGLSKKDAQKLFAILSLGKRLYAPTESSFIRIRGIEDVYTHYRSLAKLAKEQLWILLINSRYQVIHEEVLSVGSTDNLHITPKDVFQSAIERRATAVILVHNHPSGDPTPSKADLVFTKSLQKAAEVLGIDLLDHVIITNESCASCISQVS
jgi:DNA repair protein RadC